MVSVPLEELSSLVEDTHVKTQEASQNIDLDMREFLGIDKALQSIQGELFNDTSKLTKSQNRKDLQTQVAKIKQTLEKVLDKNISLAERIRTLLRKQGITIFPILTALSMAISTMVFAITGGFGGSGGAGSSPPKDEGVLKKWLDRLANALKRLAGKVTESLLSWEVLLVPF